MTKLLTICVPTYKRSQTLRRCIDSVVSQVEKYGLSDLVDVYVTNDASPDDTESVLSLYEPLRYFNGITRSQNLGMNVNIKFMLSEVAQKSNYQLIITDDDFLQSNILDEIVGFLREQKSDKNDVPIIWTPRYSYTEDGELHCVECSPFSSSSFVNPSAFNTGRYMFNGFVLSGLIVCAERIDFEYWETYKENAYFPVIFFGDLLIHDGAFYWHKNIVHHTVLNKCHWESWGRSDLLIAIKKFSDTVNTYRVMATRIKNYFDLIKFYSASLPNITRVVRGFMHSDQLKKDKLLLLDAIDEQKKQEALQIESPINLLVFLAVCINLVIGVLKYSAINMLLLGTRDKEKVKKIRARAGEYLAFVRTTPLMLKLIS